MKKMLLLFMLVPVVGLSQQKIITSVDLVRVGFWEVVSPDTITKHTDVIQATERQLNLMLSGIDPSQIVIKPPLYEVRPTFSEIVTAADTVFKTDTLKVPVFGEHEWTLGIGAGLVTANPDTTENYQLEFKGNSHADRIRVASNCYDGKQNERFSTTLDSTRQNQFETSREYFYYISPDTLDCRGIATYWVTAKKDTAITRFNPSDSTTVQVDTTFTRQAIKFIDIGHSLWIGNN